MSRPRDRRRRRPPASLVAGTAMALVLALAAVAGPALAPHPPDRQSLELLLEGPVAGHPLGLDELGRDVLARLLAGARVSLAIGAVVVLVSTVLGTTWGVLAGFFRGWLDEGLMRVADVLLAFPGILLAMAVVAVTGPSATNLVVALSITGWVGPARLVRGQALAIRELEHVTAARALGAGDLRLVLRHVLPGCLPPLLVQASLAMGAVVVAEAGLSFLGLGVAPPAASWGQMLHAGTTYLSVHLTVLPGACIALTVLAFNLVGDGLSDWLDPRGGHGA